MKLSDFTGRQWRVLLILMLVNFVNYVDRQIVFALFPYLRHDFGLTRFSAWRLWRRPSPSCFRWPVFPWECWPTGFRGGQ